MHVAGSLHYRGKLTEPATGLPSSVTRCTSRIADVAVRPNTQFVDRNVMVWSCCRSGHPKTSGLNCHPVSSLTVKVGQFSENAQCSLILITVVGFRFTATPLQGGTRM